MDDLNYLRKTAQAANDGPWEAKQSLAFPGKKVVGPRDSGDLGKGPIVLMQPLFWDERSARHADHIAAFDPPTALAILDQLETAKREASDWERSFEAERADKYMSDDDAKAWRLAAEAAESQVAKVLSIHAPNLIDYDEDGRHYMCVGCSANYPCATVRALGVE